MESTKDLLNARYEKFRKMGQFFDLQELSPNFSGPFSTKFSRNNIENWREKALAGYVTGADIALVTEQ